MNCAIRFCFAVLVLFYFGRVEAQTMEERIERSRELLLYECDFTVILNQLEETAKFAETGFVGSDTIRAMAYYNLGSFLLIWGRLDQAKPCIDKLNMLIEKHTLPAKFIGFSLAMTGLVQIKLREFKVAVPFFQQAIETLDSTDEKNSSEYATIMFRYAHSLLLSGGKRGMDKLNIAEKIFSQSPVKFAKRLALTHSLRAGVKLMNGWIGEAKTETIKQRKILKDAGLENCPDYGNAIAVLGGILMEEGNNKEGITLIESAFNLLQVATDPESVDYSKIAVFISHAYFKKGYWSKALYYAKKAAYNDLERFKIKGYSTIATISNLAQTYDLLGRNDEALFYYLKLLSDIDENDPLQSLTLITVFDNASTYFEKNLDFNKAEVYRQKCLKISSKIWTQTDLGYLEMLNGLGICYMAQGKYLEADSIFKLILKDAPPESEVYSVAQFDLAITCAVRALYEESENHFQLAVNFGKRCSAFTKRDIAHFYSEYSIASNEQAKPGLSFALMDTAFALLEEFCRSDMNMGDPMNNKALFQEHLVPELKNFHALVADQGSKDLNILHKAMDKSIKFKGWALFDEAGMIDNKEKSWGDIMKVLLPSEAVLDIVEYFPLDSGVRNFNKSAYNFYLLSPAIPNGIKMISFSGNKNEMEASFDSLYQQLSGPENGKLVSASRYINPFLEILPAGIKKVYLSGDGIFQKIDPAVLSDKNGNYPLANIDWLHLSNPIEVLDIKKHPSKGFPKKPEVVLFGDPLYDASFSGATENDQATRGIDCLKPPSRLSPLSETKNEITDLTDSLEQKPLFAQVTTYLDSSATREALIFKKEKSPFIIHIATHGYYACDKIDPEESFRLRIDPDSMRLDPFSRIMLFTAGANKMLRDSSIAPNRPLSRLIARDVLGQHLNETGLVVLSACQSGLGDVSNMDGVYGFQFAYRKAGAKSVLATLWPVDSKATTQFIKLFYQEWFKTPKDKPGALKRAKAQLRAVKEWSHPYYWGAFVLYGE